jgi:hypothetical protein
MNIRNDYPEFTAIEDHIRRAQAERSLYLAHLIANGIDSMVRGTRRLFANLGRGLQADWEKRAIEADSFLKRSVPRY